MSKPPNLPDAEIQALLSDLWKRHIPLLNERLALLERAAEAASSSPLSEEQRAEAQSTAHKLAGNLGMFGYQQAGETASEIEQSLEVNTKETLAQLPTLIAALRKRLAPYL